MKVFRYINGKRYIAEAPEGVAMTIGPMEHEDAKITAIDYTNKWYKKETIHKFPDKWYHPDGLDWKMDEPEER